MLNIDNYKNYIWNIEDETKVKNFINNYNEKLNNIDNEKEKEIYTKIIDQIIKVIIYNDITFEYIAQKIINNPFDYKYLTLINDFCKYIDDDKYICMDEDYLDNQLTKLVFKEVKDEIGYYTVHDIIKEINQLNSIERNNYQELLDYLKQFFNDFILFKDNKISTNIDDIEDISSLNDLCEITFINLPKRFLDKVFETINKKYINEL